MRARIEVKRREEMKRWEKNEYVFHSCQWNVRRETEICDFSRRLVAFCAMQDVTLEMSSMSLACWSLFPFFVSSLAFIHIFQLFSIIFFHSFHSKYIHYALFIWFKIELTQPCRSWPSATTCGRRDDELAKIENDCDILIRKIQGSKNISQSRESKFETFFFAHVNNNRNWDNLVKSIEVKRDAIFETLNTEIHSHLS